MSFFSILGTLLIRPLRLLFEVIYMMAERLIGNPGLSIIVLSLMMNFLVLPLYRRADGNHAGWQIHTWNAAQSPNWNAGWNACARSTAISTAPSTRSSGSARSTRSRSSA